MYNELIKLKTLEKIENLAIFKKKTPKDFCLLEYLVWL